MALPSYLYTLIPNSLDEPFIETSEPTRNYNCISWAYEDTTEWYWPDYKSYWPNGIPREVTIDAFRLLFEYIGYEVCDDHQLENGFQKIAIYADINNVPTHAARQLPDGLWTSKLGPVHDVTHTIHNMSHGAYGNVAIVMRRKISNKEYK